MERHVAPKSSVTNAYGRRSPRSCRSSSVNAVPAAYGLASITSTRPYFGQLAGATLFQCAPPSRVSWIKPSSVPAQMRFASLGEGASASVVS